jgi:diguanylate cyclase (GGDEF)-like protein/PAS domain S-box-containing protein
MSGYSLAEIRGKNPRIFQSGDHPAAFYRHLWSSLHAGKTWSGELKNKRRNGELYWEANSITPILDEDAQIKRYVAVKEDITEKRNLRETLYQQAHFDALTHLPNRNLFDDRLEQSLKKVVRNPAAHNMALMLLDLDHFKEVNDSRGHATGDELLKQAAERMRHCIRESDTVGRIGGDEFIILVDGFSEENTPDDIAQRLLKAMQMPFLIFGQNSHISASIGVALSSSQNLNAETLKKNADVALYEAKGQGRNRVQFFQPEVQ